MINVGCAGLVELIEKGQTSEADIHAYLKQKLAGFLEEDIHSAVLGCTHYSIYWKRDRFIP